MSEAEVRPGGPVVVPGVHERTTHESAGERQSRALLSLYAGILDTGIREADKIRGTKRGWKKERGNIRVGFIRKPNFEPDPETQREGIVDLQIGFQRTKSEIAFKGPFGLLFHGIDGEVAHTSSEIYRELKSFCTEQEIQMGNVDYARNVIAPTIFQLGWHLGASPETIQQVAGLVDPEDPTSKTGAITIWDYDSDPIGRPSKTREIYVPRPEFGKMIRFDAKIPEGKDPDDILSAEKAQQLLDRYAEDRDTWLSLVKRPESAVIIDVSDPDNPRFKWPKDYADPYDPSQEKVPSLKALGYKGRDKGLVGLLNHAKRQRFNIEQIVKQPVDSVRYLRRKIPFLRSLNGLSSEDPSAREALLQSFEDQVIADAQRTKSFTYRNLMVSDAVGITSAVRVADQLERSDDAYLLGVLFSAVTRIKGFNAFVYAFGLNRPGLLDKEREVYYERALQSIAVTPEDLAPIISALGIAEEDTQQIAAITQHLQHAVNRTFAMHQRAWNENQQETNDRSDRSLSRNRHQ